MEKRNFDLLQYIDSQKKAHSLAYQQRYKLLDQGLDYIKGMMNEIWEDVDSMSEQELDSISPDVDAPEIISFIEQPIKLSLEDKRMIVFTEMLIDEYNDLETEVRQQNDQLTATFAAGQLELISQTVNKIRQEMGHKIKSKLKLSKFFPMNYGIDRNWKVYIDFDPEKESRPN